MRLVITIDGPAGAGKTTTARGVAALLDYRYLDTGALYRALAWAVLEAGISDPYSIEALREVERHEVEPRWRGDAMYVLIDGVDVTDRIRTPEVTNMVSPLSSVGGVRDLLMPVQRGAATGGGLVVDGRDTGSVVFPRADLKVFLTAHVDERAGRRHAELAAAGIDRALEEVRTEIVKRDERDSSRDIAPLTFPEGGVEVDTTGMTICQQIARIVELARELGA